MSRPSTPRELCQAERLGLQAARGAEQFGADSLAYTTIPPTCRELAPVRYRP
jgi:hypothetical protein